MRRHPLLWLFVLTMFYGCAVPRARQVVLAPGTVVETHFSPQEEIAPTVVQLIDDAAESIDMAAFTFTHPDIAAAMIRAHDRGVTVRVIMDTTSAAARYSVVPDLIQAGIPVHTRRRRGSQHNKYIVIDRAIVVAGSYNFTIRADERNSENLLIIRDAPEVVNAFMDDYQRLRADAVPMK